jgi:hypothetical protein
MPPSSREFDLKLGCDMIERTIRRMAEPDGSSHALDDLCPSRCLHDPIFDEYNRAISKKMQIVVLQFLQADFEFYGLEANQNVFVWSQWSRSAALVVHEHEGIVRRTERRVEIRLVSVEEGIRSRKRLKWNV